MKVLKIIYNQVSVRTNNLPLNQFRGLLLNKKRNYLVLTQVINAIVALASGKLIAEFIMPEQFGLYSLQFSAYMFFFSLLVSPTIHFMKASYQKLIPQLGYRLFIITFGGLSLILFFVLVIFFSLYKPDTISSFFFYFIILLFIPFNITSSITNDQFNILGKTELFSISSIIKSMSGLIFLIFIFYGLQQFNPTYLTLWTMQLVMGFSGMIFFIRKLKKYSPNDNNINNIYRNFLKKHFKFTLPLMGLAFWSWINNFFDRYVIEAFMTLNDVGVYNANYGLGSKFFLILNPIFLVLLTPLIYADRSIKFKKKTIQKFAFNYFLTGIIILFLIYFLKDFIGSFLLSKNYQEGFYIIFWIALAFWIMTGAYLYETIFYAHHRTKLILFSNIFSALSNIILNIVLIPYFGLSGAIAAMIISVSIRFTFLYYKFITL